MQDVEFKAANNVLIGSLKRNKREGNDHTSSYTDITKEDIEKLMKSEVFSNDDPTKLQDYVWFTLQFYLCRRGGEGSRELTRDSFKFSRDANGAEFVSLAFNEASKNHPGGLKYTNDPKKKMYATGGPMCPVKALRLYISKLHPKCESFYQRPVTMATVNDQEWYLPFPVGIKRLGGMMARLSVKAGLSQRYTNHCLRATCIKALMHSGFHPLTVTRLSGHRNIGSVMSYCRDTTNTMKRSMSHALANTLDPSCPVNPQVEAPNQSLNAPQAGLQLQAPPIPRRNAPVVAVAQDGVNPQVVAPDQSLNAPVVGFADPEKERKP